MKRDSITIYDYKNRPTNVKLPKNGHWWTCRTGQRMGTLHCVISCFNNSDVFYITDKGNASIAYCDSHAGRQILENMLDGSIQRGLWCVANNGKLQPHWYYKRFMSQFKEQNPRQAKKLEQKIKDFKKTQSQSNGSVSTE